MAKVKIKSRNDYERMDGTSMLYAVINIQRSKLRIPLDITVTEEQWDSYSETIKGKSQEINDQNLIISNVRAKITDILVKFRLSGEKLTKEKFLKHYKNPFSTENFIQYSEVQGHHPFLHGKLTFGENSLQ